MVSGLSFMKPKTGSRKCFLLQKILFFLCCCVSIIFVYLNGSSVYSSVTKSPSIKDYLSEKISEYIVEPVTGIHEIDISLPRELQEVYQKESHQVFKTADDLPINASCLGKLKDIVFEEASKANVNLYKAADIKTILVWHSAYGSKTNGFGSGVKPFQQACCKERRCYVTWNKKLQPTSKFDAIIFQLRGLRNIPSKRSSHQRWIFMESESASYVYEDPTKFNNVFNWTMTYRRDSDIFNSYGLVLPKNRSVSALSNSFNYAAGKTKSIAWLVSNCHAMSYREHYVQQLNEYVPVDIYGKCGPKKCSKVHGKDCYEMIEKEYKFYLSFENSLCKDYVTEKLFNILKLKVIPVVYGFGNYKVIAPPHSYINALSFSSVKDLADYLSYLDKNDTAYNEYFKWKEDYAILDERTLKSISLCSLCKKLHEDKTTSVYADIKEWFVTKSHCRRLIPISWLEWVFDHTPVKLWPAK